MTHFGSIFLQPFSQAFAFSFSEHFSRFLCPLPWLSLPLLLSLGLKFGILVTSFTLNGTIWAPPIRDCHTWNISSKLFESRVALGNVVITGVRAAGCFNIII
jgi:hypothetical protein